MSKLKCNSNWTVSSGEFLEKENDEHEELEELEEHEEYEELEELEELEEHGYLLLGFM